MLPYDRFEERQVLQLATEKAYIDRLKMEGIKIPAIQKKFNSFLTEWIASLKTPKEQIAIDIEKKSQIIEEEKLNVKHLKILLSEYEREEEEKKRAEQEQQTKLKNTIKRTLLNLLQDREKAFSGKGDGSYSWKYPRTTTTTLKKILQEHNLCIKFDKIIKKVNKISKYESEYSNEAEKLTFEIISWGDIHES